MLLVRGKKPEGKGWEKECPKSLFKRRAVREAGGTYVCGSVHNKKIGWGKNLKESHSQLAVGSLLESRVFADRVKERGCSFTSFLQERADWLLRSLGPAGITQLWNGIGRLQGGA